MKLLIIISATLGTVSAFLPTPASHSFGTTTAVASTRVVNFESSAAKQAGAGAAVVDMNQYNLPLEQIVEEWTANLVAKSANTEGGIKLSCKTDRANLVDTVRVSFPRKLDSGLGILLQEIAGGREDGLGITLVSGLVEGGAAEDSGILEGDSVVKVAVVKSNRAAQGVGLSDFEEQFEVKTECFSYDATVDAILSLPPAEGEDEMFVVTLKRLRRKPKVRVTLQYPPSQNEPDAVLEIFSGEILRQAMLVRGVKLNDPLAKRFDTKNSGNCGASGLCQTCAVSILKGGELLNPMKNQERQIMAANPRWRLSCKTVVGIGMQEGDMTVRVNPKQWDDYIVDE